MNKAEYDKYVLTVKKSLDGLTVLSNSACAGCADCELNKDCSDHDKELVEGGYFSWRPCEVCCCPEGGDRYPVHGLDDEGNIVHLNACSDCCCYIEYGKLDDTQMMEIDGS